MGDTITSWTDRVVALSQRSDVPDDVRADMTELASFLRERDAAEQDAGQDLRGPRGSKG